MRLRFVAGKLTQYAPQDGVYVYFRHTDRLKVMVVINKSADARRIDTARFHEVIGRKLACNRCPVRGATRA